MFTQRKPHELLVLLMNNSLRILNVKYMSNYACMCSVLYREIGVGTYYARAQ